MFGHPFETVYLTSSLMLGADVVPNVQAKNINVVNVLHKACFVIMRNKWKGGGRFYIGEVLDLYTKGAGRHCSVETVTNAGELSFLSLRVYLPLNLVSITFTCPLQIDPRQY